MMITTSEWKIITNVHDGSEAMTCLISSFVIHTWRSHQSMIALQGTVLKAKKI